MTIESAGWKGRTGRRLRRKFPKSSFSRHISALYRKKSSSSSFRCASTANLIAMRLAVEYGNRLWELKITYDEQYRKCAPGRLLTHETIRYAFERGLEGHEFLGEEEDWERIWTDSGRDYRAFGLYPASMSGMMGMGMFAANFATNKAGNALTSTVQWTQSAFQSVRQSLT